MRTVLLITAGAEIGAIIGVTVMAILEFAARRKREEDTDESEETDT